MTVLIAAAVLGVLFFAGLGAVVLLEWRLH